MIVRRAIATDRDEIEALQLGVHGADEAWGLARTLDDDPGIDGWTVVVDGGRIVSALCLLSRTLRLRHGSTEVTVPTGQPEYVATAPAHRHRGHVRRQLDEVHAWTAARGDLVTVVTGIPYFYRRFGYEHALVERWHRPPGDLEADPAATVRPATPADLDAVLALDRTAAAEAGVALPRSPASWAGRLRAGGGPYRTSVVTRAGAVVAFVEVASWTPAEAHALWGATDPAALATGVAAAAETMGAGCSFHVLRRPAAAADSLVASWPASVTWPLYVRVPDRLALLDALRPVLDARLAASPLAGHRGDVDLSLYRDGIRLSIRGGEVTGLEPIPGVQDPQDEDLPGVAPDRFATLVLGRFGARGLADREDDVTLGRHADVLDALFPATVADLAHDV